MCLIRYIEIYISFNLNFYALFPILNKICISEVTAVSFVVQVKQILEEKKQWLGL